MPSLGVNIDHVATLRQARYAQDPTVRNAEPGIVAAAREAELGGAAGITVHLRGDRRHIQDKDLWDLKDAVTTKINLEMGNDPEILAIALRLKPEDVCLVPENRQEITTEGGLDCVAHAESLAPTIAELRAGGVRVSLFIDPESGQIDCAASLGAEVVELHTGAFANAEGEAADVEWKRLDIAAQRAARLGLVVNAGHGINYENIARVLKLPRIEELNIGHSIVSRAIFVGLREAVREMNAKIQQEPGSQDPDSSPDRG